MAVVLTDEEFKEVRDALILATSSYTEGDIDRVIDAERAALAILLRKVT
jgi:hypothetical protein